MDQRQSEAGPAAEICQASQTSRQYESSTCKPIKFVLENNTSSGCERRRRGRKSMDVIPTNMDRQSQRRLHQRAYRFRKQQHASEIEADRDQYCKAASQLEKELLSTTKKIDSLFTILQEMEQVFSSNNIQMQDRMKEQLKDLKKCRQRRQSLTEPTQLSARQLKPRDANDSASPDNESHAADTRETVSRNYQQSTRRNPYIPQHTALYYLQTQALLKQSEQAASKGKNALDPTFLEIALKMNDQENVNFKCLPSQSLRERILLFQDIVDVTKVVNQIIKGGICWGFDPLDTASWEMPEILFQEYWFICDEELVQSTNKWRLEQGRNPIVWDSSGRHVKKPMA